MGDEHINPELLKRLGRVSKSPPTHTDTPSSRYRRNLDPAPPSSSQPGANNLPFFWIGYFILFAVVVPLVISLL